MSSQTQTKTVGDYSIVKLIGRGNFSHVYGGFQKHTKQKIAIKHITISSIKEPILEKLISEITILKYINHPNIIGLIDVVLSERSIYIILEYCKGGDLQKFINSYKQNGMPETVVKFFMYQLREGLKVFNELGIVHRDLKPQNILLTENSDRANIKIADFGMARFMDPYDLSQTLCGTPMYMAPEILKKQPYSDNVDLWSLGVIMWEMVTGFIPYKAGNWMDLIYNLDNHALIFPVDINASEECKNLLFSLLKVDPLTRINFNDFNNHDFFINITPSRRDDPVVSGSGSGSFKSTPSGGFNNPFGESYSALREDWVVVNKNINNQLLSDIKLGSSMQESHDILNKMKIVAELGDKKASQGNLREAGSLYSYSLNTVMNHMGKDAKKGDITNFYNMYDTKRQSLGTEDLDGDCDKIIFDEADATSRKGAEQELVDNYEDALTNYKKSLCLFQSLLTYKNMSDDDKLRLNIKIDCLNERIMKTSTMLKSYP